MGDLSVRGGVGIALVGIVAIVMGSSAIAGLALAFRELDSPNALVNFGGSLRAFMNGLSLLIAGIAIVGVFGILRAAPWGRMVVLIGAVGLAALGAIAVITDPTPERIAITLGALVGAVLIATASWSGARQPNDR